MYEPPDDVVEAIVKYMNGSQADALLDIARARDSSALRAELVGLTGTDLAMRVSTTGRAGTAEQRTVRLEWPAPLTRREDVRTHLFEMQNLARLSALRASRLRKQDQ